MTVRCIFNDPDNAPQGVPGFDYGLIIHKEYLVMGIVLYKSHAILHYLIDEDGKPSWYPKDIFEITDSRVSSQWYVVDSDQYSEGLRWIVSFYEMCNDITFYDRLVSREELALRWYFRRKIELEDEMKSE